MLIDSKLRISNCLGKEDVVEMTVLEVEAVGTLPAKRGNEVSTGRRITVLVGEIVELELEVVVALSVLGTVLLVVVLEVVVVVDVVVVVEVVEVLSGVPSEPPPPPPPTEGMVTTTV